MHQTIDQRVQAASHQPTAVHLPETLSRRGGREAAARAERAVLGTVATEAATLVTWSGLQGVGLLAGQLSDIYDHHGDFALLLAKPIFEAYGDRVAAIIRGVQ